jgi:hypothetical protein
MNVEPEDLFPIFNATTWVEAERYLAERGHGL